MKRKLFGQGVDPSCAYCGRGRPSVDRTLILCEEKGISPPGGRCRRFVYDPMKRVPRPEPELPQFDPEEFKL